MVVSGCGVSICWFSGVFSSFCELSGVFLGASDLLASRGRSRWTNLPQKREIVYQQMVNFVFKMMNFAGRGLLHGSAQELRGCRVF